MEAREEPTLPTSVAKQAKAAPVLRIPRTAVAARLVGVGSDAPSPIRPAGVSSTSAASCARQITGRAPLRDCSGPVRLKATP